MKLIPLHTRHSELAAALVTDMREFMLSNDDVPESYVQLEHSDGAWKRKKCKLLRVSKETVLPLIESGALTQELPVDKDLYLAVKSAKSEKKFLSIIYEE